MKIPFRNRPLERTLCIVGQNPSDAGEEHADKTVRYLERYLYERLPQYGAILMLNLYSRVDKSKEFGDVDHPRADRVLRCAIRKHQDFLFVFGQVKNEGKYRFPERLRQLQPLFIGKNLLQFDLATNFPPHPGNSKILLQKCRRGAETVSICDLTSASGQKRSSSTTWIKAALMVRAAGRDHRAMRFVSFEGGGEALAALQSGHVDVYAGDASEVRAWLADKPGSIRVIAVLADKRLPGALSSMPTAREQGIDVVWPTVRGVYLGPGVSDADYRAWTGSFDKAMASRGFGAIREAFGCTRCR